MEWENHFWAMLKTSLKYSNGCYGLLEEASYIGAVGLKCPGLKKVLLIFSDTLMCNVIVYSFLNLFGTITSFRIAAFIS